MRTWADWIGYDSIWAENAYFCPMAAGSSRVLNTMTCVRVTIRGVPSHGALAVLVCLPLASAVANGCGSSDNVNDRQGKLNADLAAAREFKRFDLYWVGREFEPSRLTDIEAGTGAAMDPYVLGYGDCTRGSEFVETCLTPGTIDNYSVCDLSPTSIAPPVIRAYQVRGSLAVEYGKGSRGDTVIFTGRTAIDLHTSSRRGQALINALRPVDDGEPEAVDLQAPVIPKRTLRRLNGEGARELKLERAIRSFRPLKTTSC